jgi:anti-sigma regulatory factor (Ser/Thr protein kinase)
LTGVATVKTNKTATVTLRLPASAVHVRTARLVAAAMARRSGVDEALLDEVRLAVGEACARAVRLHERHGVDAPVTVEFADDDHFIVAVVDCAPTDTAPTTAPVRPDDAPAGHSVATVTTLDAPWADPTGDALGLALLAAVAQDLVVDPDPSGVGSRVVMSWPLS